MGRIILLVITLAAGGGAFFLFASGGSDTQTTVTQVVPKDSGVETVLVLVADKDFARGEVMDSVATKWVKWPKKNLPEFVVTEDNKEFFDTLGTARARNVIAKGEVIHEGRLLRHGDRGMLSALLSPGMKAATFDVTSEQSGGGFILPGDKVDLLVTRDFNNRQTGERIKKTEILYSNVRVLAIDQALGAVEGGAAIVGRTATLELAPHQVEEFINARESHMLTMALRSVFTPENAEELQQEIKPQEVVVIRYGS